MLVTAEPLALRLARAGQIVAFTRAKVRRACAFAPPVPVLESTSPGIEIQTRANLPETPCVKLSQSCS